MAIQPRGFILSGGPASVYAPGAPTLPDYVLASGLPVLGICYGMQLLTHALGGKVDPSSEREYGHAVVNPLRSAQIPPGSILPMTEGFQVWMSHGDRITELPPGFLRLAESGSSPFAAMVDPERRFYGLQFHPEVSHTEHGAEILRRFVVEVCNLAPDWTPESIIEQSLAAVRSQVGSAARPGGGLRRGRLLGGRGAGPPGGRRPAGGRLRRHRPAAPGRTRAGGRRPSASRWASNWSRSMRPGSSSAPWLGSPTRSRSAGSSARSSSASSSARPDAWVQPRFLVQGTIYPDVVESAAPDRSKAAAHQVAPQRGRAAGDMQLTLVEPLRYLFKDEVRAVGEALGLPEAMVWRQPFPGPGLTVRCSGEVTPERAAPPARRGCHLHPGTGLGRPARQGCRAPARPLPPCCRSVRWA